VRTALRREKVDVVQIQVLQGISSHCEVAIVHGIECPSEICNFVRRQGAGVFSTVHKNKSTLATLNEISIA